MIHIPVITSPHMTEPVEVEREIKRSWKERLFTWPWQPWLSTKVITVIEHHPRQDIVIAPASTGGQMIVCHPSVEHVIRDRIRQ